MGSEQGGHEPAGSRHRIRDGRQGFHNPFAIERIDDREAYGEERITILGLCDGVLLHVTYTERTDTIRIISARRAERHEQDTYFRENSP